MTSATDTMTVTSVAMISPSMDFLGLTVGASGRWKNWPPMMEPPRNAEVSNTKVRPITAITSDLPSGRSSMSSRYAGQQRDPGDVHQRKPDVADGVLAMRRRHGHEPQQRGDDAEDEHRQDGGLSVVVGAAHDQRARDEPHGRGGLAARAWP